MKNILVTERLSANALQTLKLQKNLNIIEKDEMSEAHALIIRSKTKIDAEFLKRMPKLEAIVTATSGFDHIDFASTSKIKVMHTPDANAISAAELTWALVQACSRKVVNCHRSVKSGEWKTDALVGWELAGKSYGVIGLGRIGSRVAKIAGAFGMQVVAFDPYKDDVDFKNAGATRLSYDEVLRQSDIVSFHVPKTRETYRMFAKPQIDEINPNIIIVNTSRGSVLNEADMCKALEERKIRALGLDVFENEPLSRHSNLLKYDSVVLTPHMGAATEEAYERASMQAAHKVIEFFASGKVTDSLPGDELNWHMPRS